MRLLYFTLLLMPIQGEEAGVEEAQGSVSLKMEHSFDNGKTFSARGSINIASLRSGSVTVQQNDLSSGEKSALQKLCQNDGLYLVRAVANVGETSHKSAVHACSLVDSGLADLWTIQLDWRYKIVSIHLSTQSLANRLPLESVTSFKSKTLVQHMESGPAPDTASFIQRMEEEKLAKQRGDNKDNRSFFAKYWMYIIPFVLVLFMSGGGGEGGNR